MDHTFVVTALSLLCLGSPGSAETPPSRPMRELIVQSEMVVDAAPADPAAPCRFRVVRALLGTALKEGDVFEVDGLADYDLTMPTATGDLGRKPVRLVEALLFLGPKRAARFPLTPSGLRLLTADGGAYYPQPRRLSAGYVLDPYRPPVAWDDLVREAAADAAEVRHVRSLKALEDPRRRNEALLGWVERRRREFGGGWFMTNGGEPTGGWGSLEGDVFEWVFESREPRDCWAAARLYAELNGGSPPVPHAPAFGTRPGRALLLNVATKESGLAGDRVRALRLLSAESTLWPVEAPGAPAVERLGEKEQTALIDRVTPLLADTNPFIRIAAAEALVEFSSPEADALKSFRTQRALPVLTAEYKKQPPGPARNALARAARVIGGPKAWEEITANAHGVVAVLQDPGCEHGAEAFCWLVAWQPEGALPGKPTLVLERLDDKQKVVEKKEKPLNGEPAIRAGGRSEGDMEDFHYFTFSMADFTPGFWRMTVKGTTGADNAPWASEPRLLQLTPPPVNLPNSDLTRPRIYFDGAAPPKPAVAPPGGPVEKALLDILK